MDWVAEPLTLSRDALGPLPGPSGEQTGYDRGAVQPGILHFGTGRRFRAAVAPLVDKVLAAGHVDYGIRAVSQTEGAVYQALMASGGRYVLAEHGIDGAAHQPINAILQVLSGARDAAAITAAIADRRTSLITLTVGEAALSAPAAQGDDNLPPSDPVGQIVAGLAARRAAGIGGLTILNCDNVVGSNKRLASLVDARAVSRDVQLADWIALNVRFPAVYCDRLLVDSALAQGGPADVAVEPYAQWVVEDVLGDERMALDDVGVLLVPDVEPYMRMRQRLADGGLLLMGCCGLLRGHATLDQAHGDAAIAALLDRYLAEATASLPPFKGLDYDRYAAALSQRMANPAMRLPLATCASQGTRRIGNSALPTLIDALRHDRDARAAAALVAAWMIVATGPELIDDSAERLWQLAAAAGDDWPALVAAYCDAGDLFGTIGDNERFRQLITNALAEVPGLGSLVAG